MSLATRLLAAGFAATVSLTAITAVTQLPVHADPIRVAAIANESSTTAAADWIASQWITQPATFTKGTLADAILGLAAAQTHQTEVLAMAAKLETESAGYATGPAAAGKVALVAAVMGADPRDFGGVDLIQVILDGVAADPTAGGFFGPPLAILGLARNEVGVPQALLDEALTTQGDSGAFGYVETWNGNTFVEDPDTTGMMIAALSALPSSPETDAALAKALAWAQDTRANGYWASYSPVNTAGVLGSALEDEGVDVSSTVTWLSGQQLDDGGLPASLGGTTANLMATTQGILVLAEAGYATITFVPSSTGSASSGTSSASASGSEVSTSEPTTDPSGPFMLPDTGRDDSGVGVGILVLAAGAAGALALRRR